MELDSKYKRVYADIDLKAISSNIKAMKKITKPGTKMMAVIKADGYGHGAVPIAKVLEQETDAFGVAIVEEGIELREAGIKNPILILGYTAKELLSDVVDNSLTQTVFQYETAYELDRISKIRSTITKIHIKVDTGMGRIGYSDTDESVEEILRISKLPHIEIEGVFSHFAKADETDKTSAQFQYKRYCEFIKKLENKGLKIPIKHISNSGAIIDLPEMNLDMVRCGIATYGLYPSEEVMKDRVRLKPAMEIKTHIVNVKSVPKGTGISYGWTYVTERDSIIATVPIGYGDGYPRLLSSTGNVIVKGHYAPIVGRICMDQFMIDVTDIPLVRQEDVVTIVGRDQNACITVEQLAHLAGSFNYEFICDVGKRIPRLYK